jgi:hypothetical protein
MQSVSHFPFSQGDLQMKNRYLHHQGWKILMAVMIALLTGVFLSGPVAAGNLDKLDTSLKLIPDDASFYTSMLRNREQLDAFSRSNAWAKIKSMPSVQMGLGMYQSQAQQPGSPVARFEAAQAHPEIKKLIKLAADMGSNEIFVYGGENFTDFVELSQYIVSNMRYGPAVLQATGEINHLNGEKIQAKLLLETLIDHMDLVEFPNVLVGFRLKNPAAANEALIKLEMFLNMGMEMVPKLKGHLNKETIGEQEYLVLRVDGKMIPWEAVPMNDLKQLVEDENDLKKLVEHVKNMNFVLALGVRENDLIVSLGSSDDCIKNLGSSERLIDMPEFKPLEKFADKQLTGVSYISKPLVQQINNNAKNIGDLRDFLVQMLPLANLPEDQANQLAKDIESMSADLIDMLPEMGSIMACQFMTDNGYEGYKYAWGNFPDIDGSKPLGLLKHMGGNPILGLVGRGKVSLENYDMMAKWGKVGLKYAEELGLPRLPEKERAKASALLTDLKPLLKRLNTATRDMLMPALADGQIGLVIDAKLESKQLIKSLPALDKELPIPEPALIFGVSNPELLEKAMGEYRGIYNDLLDLVCKQPELPPDAVQKIKNFKWPEAKVAKIAGGSIYSYSLPEEWGVDGNIVPNAGLSNNVAVLAISTRQTETLLREIPPKVGGVLKETDRPLAMAGWLDWTELLRSATPWVNYALGKMTDQQLGGQKESVISQVQTVLEVLSTIKSITSETYIEDGCIVKHSMVEIHDLGK